MSLEIGLFKSEVLSTLFSPISVLSSVTAQVLALTLSTLLTSAFSSILSNLVLSQFTKAHSERMFCLFTISPVSSLSLLRLSKFVFITHLLIAQLSDSFNQVIFVMVLI
ncbi:MAG: hypothetical protein GY932_07760 [Arcobacter sp.]|nr:hypothetical protein [Arcobacter sp.]